VRPLTPQNITDLVPYRPGKPIAQVQRELGLDNIIKLASNENSFGPSPLAVKAACDSLQQIHRYPDIGGPELRQELADKFAVKPENVITGSGSEGIMANIVRTFLFDDEEVLTSTGSFIGIYVLVNSRGVKLRQIPLRNYAYDLPAIAGAISPRTKVIYLANPNNPTGSSFTRTEFDHFYQQVPENVLVIMDEAYFEFAAEVPDFPDSMQYRYDNVITLRTFSKAYGLAGIRIGYGLAEESLIASLMKVKLPFEPSIPAQAAGIAALRDQAFLEKVLANNRQELPRIIEELRALGLQVLHSAANFLTIVFADEQQVNQVQDFMLHQGIILRPLTAFGLPHCLRITVGKPEENDRFLAEMRNYISKKQ
jgi:histidinol-phosphate aminotransferase